MEDIKTSATAIANAVRPHFAYLYTFGLAIIVLGVLAFAAPMASGLAVVVLAGTLILGAGVGRCIFAFQAQSWGWGLGGFFAGLVLIIAGLMMMAHPIIGLATLTLVLAAAFVIGGVSEIAWGIRMRPHQGSGWVIVGGIVQAAVGIMIWRQWPMSGVWAIGTMTGVAMVFNGWALVAIAWASRRMLREQESAAAKQAPVSAGQG